MLEKINPEAFASGLLIFLGFDQASELVASGG